MVSSYLSFEAKVCSEAFCRKEKDDGLNSSFLMLFKELFFPQRHLAGSVAI